jgi:2-polyprenyl-3-methyl-5-hydroxy-6-metoxy-1,4-benzoquinol methylase
MRAVDRRLAEVEHETQRHHQELAGLREHVAVLAKNLPASSSSAVASPLDAVIEFPESWLAPALKNPARVHQKLLRRARDRYGPHVTLGREVRLTFPLDREVEIPHRRMWRGVGGELINAATADLIEASKTFSLTVLEPHYGPNIAYDQAAYLRETRIRVLALVEELQRRGLSSGRILDLGSLYGSFALPLQRLGYEVTAVDRYREYPGLERVTGLLRAAGACVVETTREDELAMFDSLGTFDAVIAMAVIEHIPHTPRIFVESLVSHVRPGGLLILDTPNLVRYWNRVAINEGQSPFMSIKSQYFTNIPYEGHHREYTGPELEWIMGQGGCEDVRLQYLDSNMVQFEKIDRPHLQCLLAFLQDPNQADTLLVSGVVPGRRT